MYVLVLGVVRAPFYMLFFLVTTQWEPRDIRGKPPTPRGYHCTILTDSRIFLFGGYDGSRVFDEVCFSSFSSFLKMSSYIKRRVKQVHILDLAASAYLPQITEFRLDKELFGILTGSERSDGAISNGGYDNGNDNDRDDAYSYGSGYGSGSVSGSGSWSGSGSGSGSASASASGSNISIGVGVGGGGGGGTGPGVGVNVGVGGGPY